MTTPTFPLSTPDKPVAIKMRNGRNAWVYQQTGDVLRGFCEASNSGFLQRSWDRNGVWVVADDEHGFDLIPPEPERQYGHTVWKDGVVERAWWFDERNAKSVAASCGGEVVRQPLARPGEKLCVVPSREKLRKALAGKLIMFARNVNPSDIDTSSIEDAVYAALDSIAE